MLGEASPTGKQFIFVICVLVILIGLLAQVFSNSLHVTLLILSQEHFSLLRQQYPGSRLLIVSNTAGSISSRSSSDIALSLARTLHTNTGVNVLSHTIKKPGCGKEIMDYFRNTDEKEGLRDIKEDQIAIVGDRLLTDMCLANEMGSWGVWVKDGVVPLDSKSIVSI